MRHTATAIVTLLILANTIMLAPTAKAAGLDKGYVTFTVDDNESSVYSLMYPILKKYNFPATAYTVTDWVGTSGHMKWSQLKTLQNTGKWEIGNHTKSHKDLTKLSAKDMKSQITSAQNAFSKNGIKKPKAFAAPYGELNGGIIDTLKSLGFTSNRWAWSEFGNFNEVSSFDPFNITVVSLKSPMQFEDAKKLIDEAVSEKKWLVFVVHSIVSGPAGDYEIGATDLQRIADYLNSLKQSGSIDVKTMSQGVQLMGQSDPANTTNNVSSSSSSSSQASSSTSLSISISK